MQGTAPCPQITSSPPLLLALPQPEDRYQRPAAVSGRLPKEIIVYQYDVCPFCCKVKAFLDYYKVGSRQQGQEDH